MKAQTFDGFFHVNNEEIMRLNIPDEACIFLCEQFFEKFPYAVTEKMFQSLHTNLMSL